VIATARDIEKIQDLRMAGAYVMQLDVRDDFAVIKLKATEAIKVYNRIDVLGALLGEASGRT
jgi:NADP-dependent 3-hydroxy acid dehydrogenase YdfG